MRSVPGEGLARGAGCGITAAILFGARAPVSKLLLPDCPPVMLAALLYGGAAIALTVARLSMRERELAEPPVRMGDIGLLAGIIVCGGVLGPVLMLLGLQRVSGLAGSLLLNLEAPFTMLVAVLVFGEHMGSRAVRAAILIVGGGIALSWTSDTGSADLVGAACIAAACASWALDNNLTQRVSSRDPIAIVQIKATGAAAGNLALAVAIGDLALPATSIVVAALVLGALSYGVSILLDVYALRLVGAAREAAYFATAPFFGALLAALLLGDTIAAPQIVAALLMAIGVVLLVRERHDHLHAHAPLVHEHVHEHDEHHQHPHQDGVVSDQRHSHRHEHGALEHSHRHVSEEHHRHEH